MLRSADENRAYETAKFVMRFRVIALLGFLLCASAPYLTGAWAVGRVITLGVVPGLTILLLIAPSVMRRPAYAVAAMGLASAVVSPLVLFLFTRIFGGLDRGLLSSSLFWATLVVVACCGRGGSPWKITGAAGAT